MSSSSIFMIIQQHHRDHYHHGKVVNIRMCLQTSGDPFAPMSSVIQSFWIVRHTCCKHYFHRTKQSWWLMCSKLPPRQLKVGQYKGSPKHGHWHSRLPKSETKEGVAFSLRLHLAFFESRDSSSHLSNILSSGNSYLLSFTLTWAGQGAVKNWQMGAERHFEEDITCSVKATVGTYILCLPPPLPLTHLCIVLPSGSNLRYYNWRLPWNDSAGERAAIRGAFKIFALPN